MERLASIASRGAARDGERRAAVWLRDELRARGREASLQVVWLRPRWELAAATACLLALAGAVASVWQAQLGLALSAVALIALAGDLSGRLRFVRRLQPQRASQNLVVGPLSQADSQTGTRTRLIVTANLDAGRTGSVYAGYWTALDARLRRRARGHLSSPPAILTADVAGLVALAALRSAGVAGATVSAIQFVLIVVLVIALATLVDIALSDLSPGANANASGVAVALALDEALSGARLRQLEPQLVLAGAGEGGALGIEAFIRRSRGHLGPRNAIVLSIEPCGAGTPHWLERDGRLAGLRFHPTLRAVMGTVAAQEGQLGARPLRGHGHSGALAARLAGWPAIAVGCSDELGRAPRSHRRDDVAVAVDPHALAATLELCLAFVGRLDAELASAAPGA